MKKIVLLGILMVMVGVTAASEIRFSPENWDIQKWCLVAADIIIDTDSSAIAATDIVIESSLEYLDFVPTKNLFPYFFPPQTKDGKIHIIWFVADPKNTVKGSGSVGKVFFRQKNPNDTDGAFKLYFAGQGKTYDTNLSILWGIDILQKVGGWYYRFVDSWTCQYPADYEIIWWFSHMSPEDALNDTIKDIQHRQRLKKLLNRKNLVIFSWLLIILTILFIYFKKRKEWKTK